MKRRSLSHDYSYKGYYHITITTTKTLRQPLGQMAGQLDKPDGAPDAPHVALSPIGKMVEEELKESIHKFYPMLEVQDYVIMPEHLHFLLVAHSNVVSKNNYIYNVGGVFFSYLAFGIWRFWRIFFCCVPCVLQYHMLVPSSQLRCTHRRNYDEGHNVITLHSQR